jgi:hypothetical protein
VDGHAENQSAAGAAGAVALLTQLAKSSDAELQKNAVSALGYLVANHAENQLAKLAAALQPPIPAAAAPAASPSSPPLFYALLIFILAAVLHAYTDLFRW